MAQANSVSAKGPYCICKSHDDRRFMICCDSCFEWFHGKCVKVTQRESRKIDKYYCSACTVRDPSLKTTYKSATRKAAETQSPPATAEPKCDGCVGPDCAKDASDAVEMKPEKPPKGDKSYAVNQAKSNRAIDGAAKKKSVARQKRCHQCIGCFRNKNCNVCAACLERTAGNKATCLARMCVMWPTRAKQSAAKPSASKRRKVDAGVKATNSVEDKKEAKLTKIDNGVNDDDDGNKPLDAQLPVYISTRAKVKELKSLLHEAEPKAEPDEEQLGEEEEPSCSGSQRLQGSKCYGLSCNKAARADSKYCSDDCGLQVAMARLQVFLTRKKSNTLTELIKPNAEAYAELQSLQKQQLEAFSRLGELDRQEKRLKEWIELASQLKVEDEVETEVKRKKSCPSMMCILCGNEHMPKKLSKHVIKCWGNIEKRLSWGSPFQAKNEVFSLLCDQYNKTSKTYCKRLKVICPEHIKQEKYPDDLVCGAPFTGSLDDCQPEKVCKTAKKKCENHFHWDRYYQAKIDMERLILLFKLDIIDDNMHSVWATRLSRTDIIEHLLNQTSVAVGW